jgi:hypothetical protein
MKRLKLVFVGICAVGAMSLIYPASALHSWSTYHWARMESPFTLQVIDSVTDSWKVELDTALDEWNASAVLVNIITSSNDANRTRKRCQSSSGKIRVCNASYGYNGWAGLASINLDSSGHITRGTAKMNDSYGPYSDAFKNHVMCQEIGHLYGLGHTTEDGSSQKTCMDYSNDPDSWQPNSHDYEELFTIYGGHLDSYNSYQPIEENPDGGGSCNAPPGKGCNKSSPEVPPMGVRVHGNKHFEVWVANGKDDSLWIHHVTLVPEEYRR